MTLKKRRRPLAKLDKNQILDRIAAGEYVPAIAAELGISKQALAQYLARWDKAAYLAARETAAEIRLDEATMAIEQAGKNVDASDRESVLRAQLDLARARDLFRAVAWRAEREHPTRWGQRPTTAVQVNGGEGGMSVQIVSYANNNALQHEPDEGSGDHEST